MATKERKKIIIFIKCLLLVNKVLACCSSHSTCAPMGIKVPIEWIFFTLSPDCQCDYWALHLEKCQKCLNSTTSMFAESKSTQGAISCDKNGIKHQHFIYSFDSWKPPGLKQGF